MITIQTLRELGACSNQVELFREFLGDREGVEPTPEMIREAALYGLNILWAQGKGLLDFPDGLLVYKDGWRVWHLNGKLHREDGPTIEWPDGTREWYAYGQLHRKDGPAVEWANGRKEWFFHGYRHREDGPAFEGLCGIKAWYINGQHIKGSLS